MWGLSYIFIKHDHSTSCLTLIDGEWEKTTTLLDGGRCLNNDRYKHDSNFYATGTPTAVGLHHQE